MSIPPGLKKSQIRNASRVRTQRKKLAEQRMKQYQIMSQADWDTIHQITKSQMGGVKGAAYDYFYNKSIAKPNKRVRLSFSLWKTDILQWSIDTRGASAFIAYLLSLPVYYFLSYMTFNLITFVNDVIKTLPDQIIFVWRFLPFVLLITAFFHTSSAAGFWNRLKGYSILYLLLTVYTAVYPVAGKVLYESGIPTGLFNLVITLMNYSFLAFLAAPIIAIMRKSL